MLFLLDQMICQYGSTEVMISENRHVVVSMSIFFERSRTMFDNERPTNFIAERIKYLATFSTLATYHHFYFLLLSFLWSLFFVVVTTMTLFLVVVVVAAVSVYFLLVMMTVVLLALAPAVVVFVL